MDKGKKTIITIVCITILAYLVYLLSQGTLLVAEDIKDTRNQVSYAIIGLAMLYILYMYVIRYTHIKGHKIILALMGIIIISYSASMIVNNGQEGIYYGDIFILLGVIIVFLAPTNILVSKKAKELKRQSKIEVIEV